MKRKDTSKDIKSKKLYLFCFNEKSVLNNSIARTINAIALLVVVAVMFSNTSDFPVKASWLVLAPIAQSAVCIIAVTLTTDGTTFYEWDYTERKKQKRFYANYITVTVVLSGLFTLSSLVLISAYLKEGLSTLTLLAALPPTLFAFNMCNTISLFYPIFDADLTLGYKIQKKPEHWQEEGREVNDAMQSDEIMQRDFGINL